MYLYLILLILDLNTHNALLNHCAYISISSYVDNFPPVVKISVKEPVVMYDNVTLTCHITSLTDDTKIVWFVQNETLLRAINNNDKYKVTTSKSQQLSNLTITSVRHEDEMNYTCKATNFIQTGKSYPMHLSVFESKTLFIYAPCKYVIQVTNTISLFIQSC